MATELRSGQLNLTDVANNLASDSISASAGQLQLSGDVASPGNNKVYGTDGAGVKGWYDAATGGVTNPLTADLDTGGFDIITADTGSTTTDSIDLIAGNRTSGSLGATGQINLTAGDITGTSTVTTAGAVNINGGDNLKASGAATGGAVNIDAGAATGSSSGVGGSVDISAGNGGNVGGNIVLTPGIDSGDESINGNIEIRFAGTIGNPLPQLQFWEGVNYTSFRAPDNLTSNLEYVLPLDTPANGEILTWNTGGQLSWEPPGSGLFSEDGSSNIFGGTTAGASLTTGTRNFLAGVGAGGGITSGDSNIAIGTEAALRLTTGGENVFIGDEAGKGAVATTHSSTRNVGIGHRAMEAPFSPTDCVVIGHEAGLRFTGGVSGNVFVGGSTGNAGGLSGSNNTLVGFEAGAILASTSQENVLIGKGAGRALSTVLVPDDGNICLGHEAGPTAAGIDNQLFIHNSQTDTPLIHGDMTATSEEVTINGLLKTDNPNGASEIWLHSGTFDVKLVAPVLAADTRFQFPADNGTADYILRTDGSGNASWVDASSVFTSTFTLTAGETLYAGTGAGASLAAGANDNFIAGNNAGAALTTGDNNILIGGEAGQDLTGNSNIMLGKDAGLNATTAEWNILIGHLVANSATALTGNGNIVIGAYSATNLQGGAFSNVMIGTAVGIAMTTGYRNTFVGDDAGQKITTGGSNICIGHNAGPTANDNNKLFIDNTETDTPLIGGNFTTRTATINGDLRVESTSPNLTIKDTDAAANVKTYDFFNNSGTFRLRAIDDAESSANDVFEVNRTSTTVDAFIIKATETEVTGKLLDYLNFNNQLGTSHTLVIGDAGEMVTMNNAAANTVTVPPNSSVAFPVGTQILVEQEGAGQTTIVAGAGVTLHSAGGLLSLANQYSTVTLIKKATDTWLVAGDLA